MSRNQTKRSHRQKAWTPAATTPAIERWAARIFAIPRVARILIAFVFALSVTLAVSPILDSIYLNYLFTPETVVLPALIEAGFGLVMFVLGWWLIVGTVGELPPARLEMVWYFGIGALAIILVIIWLITGIASGNAPTV